MAEKDNGIIFVVGVRLSVLEKSLPVRIAQITDSTQAYEFMSFIEINMYTDFYSKHNVLKFSEVQWNVNQLENYSIIGDHIVFISKDKNYAISRITNLIGTTDKKERAKLLKGGYFD